MTSLALAFDILARDKASATLNKVGDSAEKTGGKLGHAGKVAAGAFGGVALAGIGAFTAGLVGGFKEAVSYQKITDQVAQTIKSTGGAAGQSVAGLKAYAGQLESMSGVDEERILSSQNVLLTFTQIQDKVGKGNDIFKQASLAALNLSTTLGTDVATSAVQVGKALNDPTKGITALSKAGVSFTEQQKAQIKALQASGNVMGAQKIVLGELNKEFGGAAAAAGKGFGGTIARLKDTVSDAFRDIATRALPTLSKVADFLAKALPGAIAFASNAFGAVAGVVGSVAKAMAPLASAAKQVFDILFKGDFTGGFFSEDDAAVEKIFNLRKGFQDLVKSVKEHFVPALQAAASFITGTVAPALGNIAQALTPLVFEAVKAAAVGFGVLVVAFQKVSKLLVPLTGFLKDHKTIVGSVAVAVLSVVAALKVYEIGTKTVAAVTKTFTAVQAALNVVMAMNPIGLVVLALVALAAGLIYAYKHSETFRNIVQGALHAVEVAAGAVIGFFKAHWPLLLGIMLGPFGVVAALIITHFDAVKSAVRSVIAYVVGKFLDMTGTLVHAAAAAFGWVPGIGPKLKTAAKEFDKFAAKVRASLSDIHPPPIVLNVKLAGPLGVAANTALQTKLNRLGGRALGGPVTAGVPYIVGENEPELFVPNQSGRILNQRQMAAAGIGGHSVTNNIVINNPEAEPASNLPTRMREQSFLLGA